MNKITKEKKILEIKKSIKKFIKNNDHYPDYLKTILIKNLDILFFKFSDIKKTDFGYNLIYIINGYKYIDMVKEDNSEYIMFGHSIEKI